MEEIMAQQLVEQTPRGEGSGREPRDKSMLKVGRWDHRNLLPDETCDRVFCVRCGNTPQLSEEASLYERYA